MNVVLGDIVMIMRHVQTFLEVITAHVKQALPETAPIVKV